MEPKRIYVVDAFTSEPFAGNPAAVLPLPEGAYMQPDQMQLIAREMNHAETAFVVPLPDLGSMHFGLRWFTPSVEVDLCGHATLASAHVLWETSAVPQEHEIHFHTRSGILSARKVHNTIALDFPAEPPYETALPFLPAFVGEPVLAGRNRMDWFIVLKPGLDLHALTPSMDAVTQLGLRGLIVTSAASGTQPYDFSSRFFAPQSGVPEDPVTGSAHCCLGPYWSQTLHRQTVIGYQASERGGVVTITNNGARVILQGQAVTTLEGMLRCL